jgi:hypothetical protein
LFPNLVTRLWSTPTVSDIVKIKRMPNPPEEEAGDKEASEA